MTSAALDSVQEQDEQLGIGAASAPLPASQFRTRPQAPVPLSPGDALAQARVAVEHPERMYSEAVLRRMVDGLVRAIDSSPCFAKAVANGLETFVLIEKDVAAPETIDFWCGERLSLGKNKPDDDQILEARAKADIWENRLSGHPAGMTPTVLPRPFCGDNDPAIDEVDMGVHAVVCNDCGCIGPVERFNEGTVQSAEKAIELWNKRGSNG